MKVPTATPNRARKRAIAVCGLSGSGKSTVGAFIAQQLGAIHIRSDAVRKHLAGIDLDQKGDERLYSEDFSRQTYEQLLSHAEIAIEAGFPVVIDAKFNRAVDRADLMTRMRARGVDVLFCHCTADRPTLAQRLENRRGDVSDADASLLESQIQSWQPFAKDDPYFDLDTMRDWRYELKNNKLK